ncbi:helix-turn-helix domain-containing protein [Flavobacterium plurextorum]|uniref:helix-turn-helix domain-containing protein n=1 Tax=Flavobacterium TaxID=237 RepID=UPI00214DB772|nr:MULTISPECIES: helix-turn-helix domain-containing protein [Flavobacterium]UUW08625.1 helix-turn-helix domain-containing protein [Flavobacterium plurextorum]
MDEMVTKADLHQFGILLINSIRNVIEHSAENQISEFNPEWLKSKAVRRMLNISAGTLQTLRISGKVSFKKVLGSYYYSRADLQNLFNNESQK